jgi:hypothetical protein
MTRSPRIAGLVLSPVLAIAWHGNAQAYRPFDGTDAAIAEPGQVEIELGPAQYLQIGSERTLVAPTVVLNYGLSERWELVLQGEAVHSLMEDSSKSSLVGNGLFLRQYCARAACRANRGRASQPNSASCYPASMTTRPTAPAAALRESYRSNGRG